MTSVPSFVIGSTDLTGRQEYSGSFVDQVLMNKSMICILVCSLLLACTPTHSTPSSPESVAVAPWRASLSTSGGITGGGGGVEIWSDGSVFSRDILPGALTAVPVYKGALTKVQAEKLETLLVDAKSVTLSNYSNMSTSLHWQAIDHSYRHDWVWEVSDASIPAQLKDIEQAFKSAKNLQPGTPPLLSLGGVESKQCSAALLIGQGQTYRLDLSAKLSEAKNLEVSVSGQAPLGKLSELAGQEFVSEDKSTTIKVSKVSGAWLEGKFEKEGQSGTFRVPAWATVAP